MSPQPFLEDFWNRLCLCWGIGDPEDDVVCSGPSPFALMTMMLAGQQMMV